MCNFIFIDYVLLEIVFAYHIIYMGNLFVFHVTEQDVTDQKGMHAAVGGSVGGVVLLVIVVIIIVVMLRRQRFVNYIIGSKGQHT